MIRKVTVREFDDTGALVKESVTEYDDSYLLCVCAQWRNVPGTFVCPAHGMQGIAGNSLVWTSGAAGTAGIGPTHFRATY